MNTSDAFWRRVFATKGVYNCVTSVLVWRYLPLEGDRLYFHLFLALAFVFGLGYLRVGRGLHRASRDIIGMGILGQLSVFVLSMAHSNEIMLPLVQIVVLLAGVTDLVFAVLFAIYLVHTAIPSNEC